MAHESLVKEILSERDTFFNTEVTRKIFEDHLGNQHTIIQFGDIQSVSAVKFHTVEPDIDLFLKDNQLQSMLM